MAGIVKVKMMTIKNPAIGGRFPLMRVNVGVNSKNYDIRIC